MADERSTYNLRLAYERGDFMQHELVDHDKFGSLAKKRGIDLSFGSTLRERLERLDEAGSIRPVAFLRGSDLTLREEVAFASWDEYSFEEDGWRRIRAFYSPWQLLYAKEALELGTARVSVEWLLDTKRRRRLGRGSRRWYEWQAETWHALDDTWRVKVLLLVRIQNRYFASVRGTLTTSQWTAPFDFKTGRPADYQAQASAFDTREALCDLGMDADAVKVIYERLAFTAITSDPLGRWSLVPRMAPYNERQKLAGPALHAQDFYDAAEMLRRFYHDMTGDLLRQPDELIDASDGSWRLRIFGHGPRLSYTRQDLKVELQRHGVYPHLVHLVVEGDTEKVLFDRLISAIGLEPGERGVSISKFRGVGKADLREEILRVARSYSRFPVLISDREGGIESEVAVLKRDGLLSDETTFLWNRNLEEDNFNHAELVVLAKRAALKRGGTLRLSARTLREKHRERCSRANVGLAEVLLDLAANPRHGSVRLSKSDLAEEMATFLLEEINAAQDVDELGKKRPVIGVLLTVLRAT